MTFTPEMASLLDLIEVRSLVRSGRAREIRLEHDLSLAEIGKAVGTSPATIHRWENGLRKPYGEIAVRYGRLLGVVERSRGGASGSAQGMEDAS